MQLKIWLVVAWYPRLHHNQPLLVIAAPCDMTYFWPLHSLWWRSWTFIITGASSPLQSSWLLQQSLKTCCLLGGLILCFLFAVIRVVQYHNINMVSLSSLLAIWAHWCDHCDQQHVKAWLLHGGLSSPCPCNCISSLLAPLQKVVKKFSRSCSLITIRHKKHAHCCPSHDQQ